MEGVAVQEKFEELVALYRPRIYRFALASLCDRDAAETVTVDLACISFGSMPAWPAGGTRKGDFSGAS
jgi:DNA-directed RNA polymerase specialized sigma24 family protein